MFTKPIDEITFEDVESFCKESGENVRVEYKKLFVVASASSKVSTRSPLVVIFHPILLSE